MLTYDCKKSDANMDMLAVLVPAPVSLLDRAKMVSHAVAVALHEHDAYEVRAVDCCVDDVLVPLLENVRTKTVRVQCERLCIYSRDDDDDNGSVVTDIESTRYIREYDTDCSDDTYDAVCDTCTIVYNPDAARFSVYRVIKYALRVIAGITVVNDSKARKMLGAPPTSMVGSHKAVELLSL